MKKTGFPYPSTAFIASSKCTFFHCGWLMPREGVLRVRHTKLMVNYENEFLDRRGNFFNNSFENDPSRHGNGDNRVNDWKRQRCYSITLHLNFTSTRTKRCVTLIDIKRLPLNALLYESCAPRENSVIELRLSNVGLHIADVSMANFVVWSNSVKFSSSKSKWKKDRK